MAEEETEDSIQLGGNIELSGFKELDGGSMIILKKIVGTYVRKFSEKLENFQKLSLNMKKVHAAEGENGIYELHANLVDNGKPHSAEASDRNLFAAVDSIMRKLENSFS